MKILDDKELDEARLTLRNLGQSEFASMSDQAAVQATVDAAMDGKSFPFSAAMLSALRVAAKAAKVVMDAESRRN